MNVNVVITLAISYLVIVVFVTFWVIFRAGNESASQNPDREIDLSAEIICGYIQSVNETIVNQSQAISQSIAVLQENSSNIFNSTVLNSAVQHSMKLEENTEQTLIQLPSGINSQVEDSVAEFVRAAQGAAGQFNEAARAQEKLLTDVVATVQNVLKTCTKDLQSDFSKTHQTLQAIISESMSQINDDYQTNMRQMFETMASNLAAIKDFITKAA